MPSPCRVGTNKAAERAARWLKRAPAGSGACTPPAVKRTCASGNATPQAGQGSQCRGANTACLPDHARLDVEHHPAGGDHKGQGQRRPHHRLHDALHAATRVPPGVRVSPAPRLPCSVTGPARQQQQQDILSWAATGALTEHGSGSGGAGPAGAQRLQRTLGMAMSCGRKFSASVVKAATRNRNSSGLYSCASAGPGGSVGRGGGLRAAELPSAATWQPGRNTPATHNPSAAARLATFPAPRWRRQRSCAARRCAGLSAGWPPAHLPQDVVL